MRELLQKCYSIEHKKKFKKKIEIEKKRCGKNELTKNKQNNRNNFIHQSDFFKRTERKKW